MSDRRQKIAGFLEYCRQLPSFQPDNKGDRERGDAPLFLEQLFQAFGHAGLSQAGAELESSLRRDRTGQTSSTVFADLIWRRSQLPWVIIEMKSRREKNLSKHSGQLWEYYNLLPAKPNGCYCILCNFDEFWIYDFEQSAHSPVEKIRLIELPDRLNALSFMENNAETPTFRYGNLVEVTLNEARRMGELFKMLRDRSGDAFSVEDARRFVLQCVLTLFAQSQKMLPDDLFLSLVEDCKKTGVSSYDLICGRLFQEMNRPGLTRVGRCSGVDYFNGGLFAKIPQIELNVQELEFLAESAKNKNWAKVRPAIFGGIFETTIAQADRHAQGIHFTSENDILKIIRPTIGQFWEGRIDHANSREELNQLRSELQNYHVLDPACGSGNFLYMAYQEVKHIEQLLLEKIATVSRSPQIELGFITPERFFGIDKNPFAVELARVTLMIARKVAIDRFDLRENPLPLNTLDQTIVQGDAILDDWGQLFKTAQAQQNFTKFDAIIGNPPFQSKNKMQQELGRTYLNQLRSTYPDVPGRADYCVYWFRKAHEALPPQGRAGLVATNTVRQNYSRQGGLDYIVQQGGTLTEAVASQVWSGEAAVYVSIVNWIKGEAGGKKRLWRQVGDRLDSPFEMIEVDMIDAALSFGLDVTGARSLRVNAQSGCCYQGQTHGHEGFLLTPQEAEAMIARSSKNREVIFPYLTAEELLSTCPPQPQRYVIDFYPRDLAAAKKYAAPWKQVQASVLPSRQQAFRKEQQRNQLVLTKNPQAKVNHHHQNFLNQWWLLSYPRPELSSKLQKLPRYIACGRVTKRPIFAFIDSAIHPNDALQVFALSDDYSFGILQSSLHWHWFQQRCSTLKSDYRYTSNTVFDSFPWPQLPLLSQVEAIAQAAVQLRQIRQTLLTQNQSNLRQLYRPLDHPGTSLLHTAHATLDQAVRQAYGFTEQDDDMAQLLHLNQQLAQKEAAGEAITGPGLPPTLADPTRFITPDCLTITG